MKTLRLKNSMDCAHFRCALFVAPFIFAFLALLPIARAVSPPPDGGYPGGNTAEGQNALFSLTTGGFNTAVGLFSLKSNTTGSFCTGVGAGTLLLNTADENTAIGAGALLSNTTGSQNTANGTLALFLNTTGSDNTASGEQALLNNTEGSSNTAHGAFTLATNTNGTANTATGMSALFSNTIGNDNTAMGSGALFLNVGGNDNTASGSGALFFNTAGDANTATGRGALQHNTSGDNNTATGVQALESNTSGFSNTASGFQALTASNGDFNTAIGFNALPANTTGSFNTALGDFAGLNVTTAEHVICIGTGGANESHSCYIGNIFFTPSAGGTAVFVNTIGKLGTTTSSRRFKEEIKPAEHASEALFALKPVTFRYKKEIDPVGRSQFGLVAEEVEGVDPDLVVHDEEGKPYSVRYDQVNAMLLNEFLKEHRKGEQQDRKIEELRATVAKLQSALKEQAAQIQIVSNRLELSRPAPRIVKND